MADSALVGGPAARICAKCEHAMINDSDMQFEMGTTSHGVWRERPQCGDVPTRFFLTDHLPDLSRLRLSAQQGCDFCGFLRALILLDDTRDRLRSEYKTDVASLGSSEIKISIIFKWRYRDVDGSNYLVVNVDFGSGIQCNYWNSLNQVNGIVRPKTSMDQFDSNAVQAITGLESGFA